MTQSARSGFAYYAQSIMLPASISLTSTGLIAGTRIHFSQPIDIIRIMMLTNGTNILVDTAMRWKSVSNIGGSSVVRTSQELIVGTAIGASSGVGVYTNLTTPLRVDPGEQAVLDVTDVSASDTCLVGFLYRTYGFNGPAFPLNQFGVAPPEDRLAFMTEVIAA